MRVPVGGLSLELPAGFRRDEDVFARSLATEARDQPLAAAVAVHVGGVNQIDTGVHRRMQGLHRLGVVDLSPEAPDSPGAEAHGHGRKTRPPKRPRRHFFHSDAGYTPFAVMSAR